MDLCKIKSAAPAVWRRDGKPVPYYPSVGVADSSPDKGSQRRMRGAKGWSGGRGWGIAAKEKTERFYTRLFLVRMFIMYLSKHQHPYEYAYSIPP